MTFVLIRSPHPHSLSSHLQSKELWNDSSNRIGRIFTNKYNSVYWTPLARKCPVKHTLEQPPSSHTPTHSSPFSPSCFLPLSLALLCLNLLFLLLFFGISPSSGSFPRIPEPVPRVSRVGVGVHVSSNNTMSSLIMTSQNWMRHVRHQAGPGKGGITWDLLDHPLILRMEHHRGKT